MAYEKQQVLGQAAGDSEQPVLDADASSAEAAGVAGAAAASAGFESVLGGVAAGSGDMGGSFPPKPPAKAPGFDSALRFLLDEKEISGAVRLMLLSDGVTTVSRLALLAETRAELKEVFTTEWKQAMDVPGARASQIRLLEAWEVARTRVDEERRVSAEARAAGEPATLPQSSHRALRVAVEERYDVLDDTLVPHTALVDQVLHMVEEDHAEFISLTDVFAVNDAEPTAHQLQVDPRGGVRVKRKRLERAMPVDSESLRRRLRTWGLAFSFARARHPARAQLSDATPSTVGAYVDHLLGDTVAGFRGTGSNFRVPFQLLLSYDAEIRKKQAWLMNRGSAFGVALELAMKDTETRERAFVTPLLLQVASSSASSGSGRGFWPAPPPAPVLQPDAAQPDKKRKKDRKKGGGQRGDGKGTGKGSAGGAAKGGAKGFKPAAEQTMHQKTADGREICFRYQRGNCTGECKRVHVCRVCLGGRAAKDCTRASR